MASWALTALRTLQGLAAVTNIVLSGLVINWYTLRTSMDAPSSFNFLMFAPIFSVLSIAYLVLGPRCLPVRWTHPYALLGAEAINTIFYFAGFIALAVFLNALLFCNGAVCAVGRAISVVAAAEFITWMGSTLIRAKEMIMAGDGLQTETDADCSQGEQQMRQV
ncbi:MARVEL-like domain protein [Emericellopsis cladophorae]|uniref:MARVEL-like domain protein n=1 Tax=Emericellopsis cladophorae TaxID=2686198 RepID=A0A9P9XZT7_9HYPO|nr:MARVEL-like domain protein [Emericellopsis cladophorae]KAI6780896.1 MARVEL-like domain protein [Emericellopsis cladophorae]